MIEKPYRPDPEAVRRREATQRRRRWFALGLMVLLLAGALLPHIDVSGARGLGRSLVPASAYFLKGDVSSAVGGSVDVDLLGLAINVTYLGLGLQELGLVLTGLTFWLLGTDDLNRWMFRMVVIGGWLLALSPPLVIWGWFLLSSSGLPASLGVAWLPVLISGIAITIGARQARSRIDDSWYLSRPELM